MLTSLRSRMAVFTVVTIGCGLGGCSLAIYMMVRHELMSSEDAVLLAEARSIASFIEYDEERGQFAFHGEDLLAAGGANLLVSVRSEAGKVPIPLAHEIPPDVQFAFADVHYWTWKSAEGIRWRAVECSQRIADEDEEKHGSVKPLINVTLSRPVTELHQRLFRIAMVLTGVTMAAAVILSLFLAWGTRRVLRPLQDLAERLSRLDGRRLDTRLPLPISSIELVPVVRTLNQLLERIDAAFERERGMGSALAHELRTPLAGLRAVIDVSVGREREAGAYRRALIECQQMTEQLQGMAESLLLLTRLERGQVPVRHVFVDMSVVLRNVWTPLTELARVRGLQVSWELSGPLELLTDPDLLLIIVRNLFANAVDYTDPAGCMSITGACSSGRIIVCISNTCMHLTTAAGSLVFERFWRGDQSRSGDDRHCGLGLGLSRDIATVLGGSLTATIADGIFSITLDLESHLTTHGPLIQHG